MNRKIRFTNFGLLVLALYFLANFAVDLFILYKVVFLFDKMATWTLGLSNVIIGHHNKWTIISGVIGLSALNFLLALFANSLRIRPEQLEPKPE